MKLNGGGDRVLANPFVPVNSLKKKEEVFLAVFSLKKESLPIINYLFFTTSSHL